MPGTLETSGVAVKALAVGVGEGVGAGAGAGAGGVLDIVEDEELPPPPQPASARALAPVTNQAKDDRIFFIGNLSIGKMGGARAPSPSSYVRIAGERVQKQRENLSVQENLVTT